MNYFSSIFRLVFAPAILSPPVIADAGRGAASGDAPVAYRPGGR